MKFSAWNVSMRCSIRWTCALVTVLSCHWSANLQAQQIVPSVEWEQLYPEFACNISQVFEAPDNGYILGGGSFDQTAVALGNDYRLIRVDDRGAVQWAKIYGGTGNEGRRSFRQTAEGGYIAAILSDSAPSGNKESPHFGLTDVWIIKMDAEGGKQWEQSFGGGQQDRPIDIWPTRM